MRLVVGELNAKQKDELIVREKGLPMRMTDFRHCRHGFDDFTFSRFASSCVCRRQMSSPAHRSFGVVVVRWAAGRLA